MLGGLAHVVEKLPDVMPGLEDEGAYSLRSSRTKSHRLVGPQVDGDTEASVFINLVHVQAHRRTRALLRLAAGAPTFSPRCAAEIWAPLTSESISPDVDHTLAN